MVNEELIALVESKFQQGEKRAQIIEELAPLGYQESDIDAAISHIQKEAFKQMPVISNIYRYLEQLDSRASQMSPKMTAAILGFCGIFVIVLAFGLYVWFDPLGTKNLERDTQREIDAIALRNAIDSYYDDNRAYPEALEGLSPQYIEAIPRDPVTGENYQYTVLDGTSNYELCVAFEGKPLQCIASAHQNSPLIPIVITPTQVPLFMPQSASQSASDATPSASDAPLTSDASASGGLGTGL